MDDSTRAERRASASIPAALPTPSDVAAEQRVLAAMFRSSAAADRAAETLTPQDFYRPGHAAMFEVLLELRRKGDPCDPVIMAERLKARGRLEDAGGVQYVITLMDLLASGELVEHHAAIVKQKSLRRQCHRVGLTLIGEAANDAQEVGAVMEGAQRALVLLTQQQSRADLTAIGPAVMAVYEEAEARAADPSATLGLASGFPAVDRLTNGWQPGDLVIVAGRPSMGKTAFALETATHAAEGGARVAVFSLEMSREQLALRLLVSRAGVEGNALRNGGLSRAQWERVAAAASEAYSLPMLAEDQTDITVADVRAKCRRMAATGGLSLVVVDYIGLMRSEIKTDNRAYQIGEITRGLKMLAKELKVPVIALSQLSRDLEKRDDKRPRMSDVRESGNIEQDADLVCFVYRDAYYSRRDTYPFGPDGVPEPEPTEFIVAKNRNGPTGKADIGFIPAYAKFVNLGEGPA